MPTTKKERDGWYNHIQADAKNGRLTWMHKALSAALGHIEELEADNAKLLAFANQWCAIRGMKHPLAD